MKPSRYALAASALFAVQAIFPVVHLLAGGVYPGTTRGLSIAWDLWLAVIWIAAAIAGVVRRSGVALGVMCVGAMASLMHGLQLSVLLSSRGPYGVGLPFLAAAVLALLFSVRAIPAFRREREEEPSGHSFGDRLRTAASLKPRHAP